MRQNYLDSLKKSVARCVSPGCQLYGCDFDDGWPLMDDLAVQAVCEIC